eukprot:3939500-Rhodomonas_salina.1
MVLRACYAMCGTDTPSSEIAYGSMGLSLSLSLGCMVLRVCYGISGTHIAYGTTGVGGDVLDILKGILNKDPAQR